MNPIDYIYSFEQVSTGGLSVGGGVGVLIKKDVRRRRVDYP